MIFVSIWKIILKATEGGRQLFFGDNSIYDLEKLDVRLILTEQIDGVERAH